MQGKNSGRKYDQNILWNTWLHRSRGKLPFVLKPQKQLRGFHNSCCRCRRRRHLQCTLMKLLKYERRRRRGGVVQFDFIKPPGTQLTWQSAPNGSVWIERQHHFTFRSSTVSLTTNQSTGGHLASFCMKCWWARLPLTARTRRSYLQPLRITTFPIPSRCLARPKRFARACWQKILLKGWAVRATKARKRSEDISSSAELIGRKSRPGKSSLPSSPKSYVILGIEYYLALWCLGVFFIKKT